MTLRRIFGLWITLLLAASACAQANAVHAASAQELRAAIRPLGSTLRVLQITAHPSDEDGALLLYLARGQGAQVTLLTLTRGERGDNRSAVLEPTAQGLLRTMEQLASDGRYGVEQRFTRVLDFGFARTAGEVFDRWAGHDVALGDVVRVIRELRPEIIITPFDPSAPDGDGQHEAAAILAQEAFRAAADPKKFPAQLRDGLEPWQARRLFALARSGGYTVAFHSGEIGRGELESWQQQAERALAVQHSQEGAWHAPREAVRHYRLIDSAPETAMPDGAEDFTDGLNTGLASLLSALALGSEEVRVESHVKAMTEAFAAAMESTGERTKCVSAVSEYLRNLGGVEDRLVGTRVPAWLRAEVATKRRQAEHALAVAAGVHVHANLMQESAGSEFYVLTPGANFAVEAKAEQDEAANVRIVGMELKAEGGRWSPRREWTAGATRAVFRGKVPPDAPFTRPTFLLDDRADGAYRLLDERSATLAMPPPSLQVVVEMEIEGEVVRFSVPVEGKDMQSQVRTAMVAPPISVIVEPRTQWNQQTNLAYGEIRVRVRSNVGNLQSALLSVHPAPGWRAEPEHEALEIEGRGEEHTYRFFLVQERGGDGEVSARAVVRWGGIVFDQGYTVVPGPSGQVAFDYRSSSGSMVPVKVEIPGNLTVAYVGVEGDAIPAALRDLHIDVTELRREELEQGRLGKYWAIVFGPHAVDAHDELAGARERLLLYAKEGGAVLILGQSDAAQFARNAPLPYPMELGTAQVSNEASAVEMIDQHDDAFQEPNEISDEDFRGWIEERGRHFARSWNAHYEPLLRMGDHGQPLQEGSLVRARYGRGSVVYSGLSFSRQLSDGVPGALRLLVNLLSSSAELRH